PPPPQPSPFPYTTLFRSSDGISSATATVTVTVVNTGPTAANDTATTRHDQAVNVFVLGNDHDANGDQLTVTPAGPPANGTATADSRTAHICTPVTSPTPI